MAFIESCETRLKKAAINAALAAAFISAIFLTVAVAAPLGSEGLWAAALGSALAWIVSSANILVLSGISRPSAMGSFHKIFLAGTVSRFLIFGALAFSLRDRPAPVLAAALIAYAVGVSAALMIEARAFAVRRRTAG